MISEESSWINSIVSGSPHAELAFSRLTQKYGPRLYTQIIRIVKNEVLAKDVLQNVMIKVWQNLRLTCKCDASDSISDPGIDLK